MQYCVDNPGRSSYKVLTGILHCKQIAIFLKDPGVLYSSFLSAMKILYPFSHIKPILNIQDAISFHDIHAFMVNNGTFFGD